MQQHSVLLEKEMKVIVSGRKKLGLHLGVYQFVELNFGNQQ